MSDIVERLKHPQWVSLPGQAYPLMQEARAEIKRLNMELRAMRQDDGAVIAGLQAEIERLKAAMREIVDKRGEFRASDIARAALENKD